MDLKWCFIEKIDEFEFPKYMEKLAKKEIKGWFEKTIPKRKPAAIPVNLLLIDRTFK